MAHPARPVAPRWSRAVEPGVDQREADLLHATGLATWGVDPRSGTLRVSRHLATLFGLRDEHDIGDLDDLLARAHPDDALPLRAAVTTLQERAGTCDLDVRVHPAGGPTRWLRVRARSFSGPGDEVSEVMGIAQDTTERKVAEMLAATLARDRELGDRAWKDRIHGLVANAFDAVALLDESGRVVDASPSLGIDLGYRPGPSSGQPLLDLVHPDDRPKVAGALMQLRQPGARVGPMTARLLTAGGTWQEREAVATSILDATNAQWIVINARRRLATTGVTKPSVDGALANNLIVAVEEDQFRLAYQPQFSIESGQLIGFEALLRWDRPGFGPVPPGELVAAAEAHDLIGEVGRWVLYQACRDLARWRARHRAAAHLQVSVNVSPRQFGPSLAGYVSGALTASGLDASDLCLEVTESAVMEDVEHASWTLRSLQEQGIRISIDDFGTGYSSLAHLRRLDLDELKIDRSFVAGLGTNLEDGAVVAAIVALAHALDLSVVAEGVETEQHLEELRRLGCQVAQGYLLGRPGAPDRIDELLANPDHDRLTGSAPTPAPRVLVVDDAPEVLMLAEVSLTTAGFTVLTARTGQEAIDIARAERPDALVLDVELPDRSGLQVCEEVRADLASLEPTIIMLTARSDPMDKVRAFTAGADDYMVKPFAPRDLVSRLHAAMRRPRAAR